jgi:hypothetical protein
VRDYRLKCDEVWLIASGDQHSSIFDFPRESLEASYGRAFERLFLFHPFGRRYFELRRECETGIRRRGARRTPSRSPALQVTLNVSRVLGEGVSIVCRSTRCC